MGYTHYWRNPNGFTEQQFARLQRCAVALFESAECKLGNGHGRGEPEVTPELISFNGWEDFDEDHETCYLERKGDGFAFCKTARKPYDTTVVALLECAARINPEFTWESDGDDDETACGRALAGEILNSLDSRRTVEPRASSPRPIEPGTFS